MKNIIIFLAGGFGYNVLELLWRGHTHPSMFLAGGICFVLINIISDRFREMSVYKKGLLSTFSITATEMVIGVVVNIKLGLGVWDYSSLPLNLNGQISLVYSLLWFILSILLIKGLDYLKKLRS